MGQGKGIKEVAYFDCAGGGQVVVVGQPAYVGNLRSSDGTAILDVSDPNSQPRRQGYRACRATT